MEQIIWPSGTTVTSKINQWLTLKNVQSVLTCTSGTTCANCTSCLKLSSDKFLKISEGRQEGTGEWRRLELVKNGASERSSVTRLEIFWEFYATNCPTKVAQIFGDSLGNFENHHFLAKNYSGVWILLVRRIWKFGRLFLQNLVTLERSQVLTFDSGQSQGSGDGCSKNVVLGTPVTRASSKCQWNRFRPSQFVESAKQKMPEMVIKRILG